MSPEQFVYWLQGCLEVTNPKTLDARQTQIIKDHLGLVFNKVTPVRNKAHSNTKGKQEKFTSKKLVRKKNIRICSPFDFEIKSHTLNPDKVDSSTLFC